MPRKRRKQQVKPAVGRIADVVPPLEPLFPGIETEDIKRRGRVSRFFKDEEGEVSDRALLLAKTLAAAGTALNPATAPLNEATIGTIEGTLLTRGTTKDELIRQEEERKRQRFQGSRLGSLESLQPTLGGGGGFVPPSPTLQETPFSGGGGSIASALGAPGGGTPQAPFSVKPPLEPLRLGRRNLRRTRI